MIKPYFPKTVNQIPPLRHTVTRKVRFEEVDPLGIVWHGRYASFFEDARTALDAAFGIGYMDFYLKGIFAPIKKMHVDYHLPLKFEEVFTIEAILHWTEAARINHEFIITNAEGRVATTGYTVQMMLDGNGDILVVPPPFYRDFCEKWKNGKLV